MFIYSCKKTKSITTSPGGFLLQNCEKCSKNKILQRQHAATSNQKSKSPFLHYEPISSGQLLDAKTPSLMGSCFSNEFRNIRIHAPRQAYRTTIGPANDDCENEANHMADRIMQMTEPNSKLTQAAQDKLAQRPCSRCEDKFQRQMNNKGCINQPNMSIQARVSDLGSGSPLPMETRRFFERRFDYNFEKIRIHTDMEAGRSAANIQAKAYTFGNDIVFGTGKYQPSTFRGQHLLAHELTHVIQQNTAMIRPFVQRLPDPECGTASGLPFSDGCTKYLNTCYSKSFTATGGTEVTIKVTVNYADRNECSLPAGQEDFRVTLYQCGWINSEVKDFGVTKIGSTFAGKAILPGAGIIYGNDNYYLRVYSRSDCNLSTSMNVT